MFTLSPREGMLEMSLTEEEPEECLLWPWLPLLEPGLWAANPWKGPGVPCSVIGVSGVAGGESTEQSFVQEGGEGRESWAGEEMEGDGSPTMEVTICCDEQ